MKYIKTLFFIFAIYGRINAQGIYFISGEIQDNLDYPKVACSNSFLLKLENKKIFIVDTITRNHEQLYGLKYYQNQNMIIGLKQVFFKEGIPSYANNIEKLQLFHIRTNNKINVDTITLETAKRPLEKKQLNNLLNWSFPQFSFLTPILYHQNDSLRYIVEIINQNESKFIGIDLKSLQIKNASDYDYIYGEVVGENGVGIHENIGSLNYKLKSNDGKITINTFNKQIQPLLTFKLNNIGDLKIGEEAGLSINTNNLFSSKIIKNDFKIDKKLTTKSAIQILNKLKNEWREFSFSTNDFRIRTFGSWIVGEEVQYYSTSQGNRSWESPGKKSRLRNKTYEINKKITEENPFKIINVSGLPFDERSDIEQSYFTGNLFAINCESWDFYSWQTKQGDSEVLLVDENKIYYRIANKIYFKKIIDKKLGKENLLLFDSQTVPFIHWMFILPR